MQRSILIFSAATLGLALSHVRAHAATEADSRFLRGGETAFVRRDKLAPWRKLNPKAVVPPLAEVRCEEACQLRVDADNVLDLAPGAVVSLSAYFYVPLVATGSLQPARQVWLREGHVEARSARERGIPLVVSGPGGAMHVALRGAEVQITVRNGRMNAQVTEGTARVGANTRWITLERGQASTLGLQGPPSDPRPGTPPPEWRAGDDCSPALAIVEPGKSAPIGACWNSPPRAGSYIVEFSRDEAFATVESSEITKNVSWSKTLPQGRYFMRVRTVDEDDLVSSASAPRKLGVLAVGLPPGASVNMAQRAVVVPEGRAVDLGDISGLETALDQGIFVTIRSPIVIGAQPKHTLRIRFKDDAVSESTLHLYRRALRADIEISPRKARWPVDPVDITVTVRDPSGVADPTRISPKLRVLLGLTELPTAWTRNGAVFSTRLTPRNVGATVVRVIAEDEFGNTLGRHFLEVGDAPGAPGTSTPVTRRIAHN